MKSIYFALGVANNMLLILIFLLRKNHLPLIQSYGWIYLLLAIPAIYLITIVQSHEMALQYTIFLCIFLAFLALEGLFDFVLKIPFRENWALLASYLVLYYAMNYGFIVMTWKFSLKHGIIMLILFIIQLAMNLMTH
ncbi:hypothetical protein JW964_09650 [candidate division KSB1 bacterium]|nr:hypothetical protein [candidate division KSB1 bacterium]